MASNVPTVKQIAWISLIPQLTLTGIIIYIYYIFQNQLRWSCLGGHFFCQISKQILFKTEDGETHPLAVNRSVLGGARKVI
jgi:hypothetical protein